MSVVESVISLAGRDRSLFSPVPVPEEVVESIVARDSSTPSQHASPPAEEEFLAEIFDCSVVDTSEGGSVNHLAVSEASGSNRWYLPSNDWMPV